MLYERSKVEEEQEHWENLIETSNRDIQTQVWSMCILITFGLICFGRIYWQSFHEHEVAYADI